MSKFSVEIKWGILFVLMQLTWMVMERLAGFHDVNIRMHETVTNFVAIPAIAWYVFALLEKRRKSYSGYMTYKQGVVSGLIITLVVTLFSPLTQYITSTIITPQYFANAISYAVETRKQTQEQAEAFFNLSNYLFLTVVSTPVMGLITTLIVAFFVKKDPPPDHSV